MLYSTELEAAEAVQPEGKSRCVWKSFGCTLGTIRGDVADCCDHFDGGVLLTRVVRARPEHYVVDVHVKVSGVHSVHNLLGLLHPLPTFRKIHRVDEERALVPHVSLDPGRFCKQDFCPFRFRWPLCQTGKRRWSQPAWRFKSLLAGRRGGGGSVAVA